MNRKGKKPDYIIQDVEVPLEDAILGKEMEIFTVNGNQTLTIPPLTNHGETIVLEPPADGKKDRSFKGTFSEYKDKIVRMERRMNPFNWNKSDKNKLPTLVEINITIPEELSETQKEVVQALQTLAN